MNQEIRLICREQVNLFILFCLNFHTDTHTQAHTQFARVVELVDTQDLKSCDQQWSYGFNSRLGHRFQQILIFQRM